MKIMTALAGAAALALIPANAGAQAQEATTATQPSIDAKAVVADVRRILNENYVLPELRPQLDAALAKGLAEGRYDVTDTGALAERINFDLEAVAHDHHLGMHFDPKQSAELAARPAAASARGADSGRSPRAARVSDRTRAHG